MLAVVFAVTNDSDRLEDTSEYMFRVGRHIQFRPAHLREQALLHCSTVTSSLDDDPV